jgi:hypothetical protein
VVVIVLLPASTVTRAPPSPVLTTVASMLTAISSAVHDQQASVRRSL